MNLRGPRRKLVVDEDKTKVKIVNKTKTRANWFAMQEERKAKEAELAHKQEQLIIEQQLNIERGKLISKKILTLINEQDVQF